MSNLRIVGLLIGIIGLFLTFRIYRGPRWNRLNFVLTGAFSISLIAVSINPNLVNTIAGMFALRQAHRGRIIALLIFSNIFFWFFLMYVKSKLDEYRHQFDYLIRRLGQEEARSMAHQGLPKNDIAVIIPSYNEAENLEGLLHNMPKEVKGRDIGVIVVDDCSSDATEEIVKSAGYLFVKNKIHRGGGAALRLGYDIARRLKPQVIVTMDADGQHNPQEIESLVLPIFEDNYDFVIGSRILGSQEKVSQLRFIGLRFFNSIISVLLGRKITDCSSGFRAFKVSLPDLVDLDEDQFHTSELIIDAVKKGVRVGEVPVSVLKRKYGKSKKGKDWKYGLSFARVILKTWWR